VVAVVGTPDEEAAALARREVTAELGGLADLGVTVTVVPETADGSDAVRGAGAAPWLPQAARQASSPWVVPWRADHSYGEAHLLDLACARECAQADAVGYAGLAYAYVTSLEPALARREFFGSDRSDQGLRFFSLS
jgi:hypothetical protein